MNALIFENASPVRSMPRGCRLLDVEQTGRPRVRARRPAVPALVADGGDPLGRFIERMAQIGVGAEGKAHDGSLPRVIGTLGMGRVSTRHDERIASHCARMIAGLSEPDRGGRSRLT